MSESPRPVTIDQPVTITVNGSEVTAQKGELLIDACERAGTYIPRFCYHSRMSPVGMCRMCLVEVDTGRGPALQPSCMLECGDGMSVDTESAKVRKAQDGVLEFLLANHPLDCPVCDKGGECPLQDTTVAYGPGESRWVEEKRHYEKPIAISATVQLDRERCILCDRCTRFADEVAGDPLIHFMHRGSNTQVNTFPGEPFSSYFSGNTVQICPVGALTATPYRFKARPWDLEHAESTCTTCSVGCRVSIDTSRDEVLRYNGVDSDPVNWGWLCDKGRFGFEAIKHEERLVAPLVRSGDSLVAARWNDALDAAVAGLRSVPASSIAVLGGARLTNEAAYAWAKLAKGVLGTDNTDCQLGDGLPADAVLGLPVATIDDVCRPGGTVIYLGPDPKEALPVLFIRLRHAIVNDGVKVVELTPQSTSLTPLAAASLTYRPGEAGVLAEAIAGAYGAGAAGVDAAGVDAGRIAAAADLLAQASGPITVVIGRPSVAESASTVVDAIGAIVRRFPDATFLPALRRGNVIGALNAGLAPGVLPGRVRRADAAEWFGAAWPRVPEVDGEDAAGILRAAAEGRIDTLVLLGADPLGDFPDASLAEQAFIGARRVVAIDLFLTESARRATVVLPATGFAETDGTTTNIEGRVTQVVRRVTPPGTARSDWQLAVDLADRLGADLGFESLADIQAEMDELSAVHAGLTVAAAASDLDGVVLPLVSATVADPAEADADATGSESASASDSDSDSDSPAAEATAADATVADEPASDADAVAETAADVDDGLIPAPAPLAFVAPAPTTVPALDAYAARLVVGSTLYDAGTMVRHARSSAGLGPAASIRLHPLDHSQLGLGTSGRVRVINGARSTVLTAVADGSVARGTAVMIGGLEGGDDSALIDVTAAVTDVRLEVVS